MSIYLIEQDPIVRKHLEKLLAQRYDVTVGSLGSWQKSAVESYSMLLINAPYQTSEATERMIRSFQNCNTPVLITCTFPNEFVLSSINPSTQYLEKPFSERALLSSIWQFL